MCTDKMLDARVRVLGSAGPRRLWGGAQTEKSTKTKKRKFKKWVLVEIMKNVEVSVPHAGNLIELLGHHGGPGAIGGLQSGGRWVVGGGW